MLQEYWASTVIFIGIFSQCVDLISKSIIENHGIRQEAFETLHSFCIPIEKNAAEATVLIHSALGESAVTHKTCKKWFQRFRNGDFDLSD